MISKTRNPVTSYTLNTTYHVEVFKLSNINSNDIINKTKLTIINSGVNKDGLSDIIDDFRVRTGYHVGRHVASSINLFVDGFNTSNILKNDSTIYYHANIKEFSISYDNGIISNIWGEVKENDFDGKHIKNAMPLEFILLKRKGQLYFILAYSLQKTNSIKAGYLVDMLK